MPSLDSQIQEFVTQHPDGWSHDDWHHFLERLSSENVDIPDVDQLGSRLEAERLRRTLLATGLKGLGPRRVDAIVERFGTVWNLRQADPEQLANVSNIPPRIAEELHSRLMT